MAKTPSAAPAKLHQGVPLASGQKIPLDQAIGMIGSAHGLTPNQAASSAVQTQFGLNPAPVLVGRPKT